MKRMLKSIFSFVILASTIFTAQAAFAEEKFQANNFPYSDMQIQVMPEFDNPAGWDAENPSLLVGYYGTIVNKSGSEYDGELEFPLPLDSTDFQIYLVAEFQEENQPEVQLNYEKNEEKGVISWKPTKPILKDESYQFVIEYYANPFTVAEKKSFTYSFEAKSAFGKIDILFLAPFKSEGFTLDKEAANISKSEYGEEIYQYEYKDVNVGNVFDFNVTYKKDGNEPTLAVINSGQIPNDEAHAGVQSGDAVGNSQAGGSNNTNPIINTTGAVIIGVSIIIAGVLLFMGLRMNAMNKRSHSNINNQKVNTRGNFDRSKQKKKLRQMLVQGEIDQQAYDDEIKKLY